MGCGSSKEKDVDQYHYRKAKQNDCNTDHKQGQVQQDHQQGYRQGQVFQGTFGHSAQERVQHNPAHEFQRGYIDKRSPVYSVHQHRQTGQNQSQCKSTSKLPTRGPQAKTQKRDHPTYTTASPRRLEGTGNLASPNKYPYPLPRRLTMDNPGNSTDVREDRDGAESRYAAGLKDKCSEEIEDRNEDQDNNRSTLGEKKKVKEGERGDASASAEGQTIKQTTAKKEYKGEDKVKVEGHDKVKGIGNEKGESEGEHEVDSANYRKDKEQNKRQSTEKEWEKNKDEKGNSYEDENQHGDVLASDENGKSKKDELKTHLEDNKEELKEQFIEENFEVHKSGKLNIFQANLKNVFEDKESGIRKLEFGQNTPKSWVPEKVLMLVGATGSGKTTMINAILNFIFGVQWSDDYRLKLVPDETPPGQKVNQAVSQTQWITAYTIHYQPWFKEKFTLTIIDTPGLGDTRGIKRDQKIMKQISDLFKMDDSNGIGHLDVVGFVTQASLARLGHIQRYIFESILSLFGKDIQKNIFMLLTFADDRKPQVLSGLAETNMTFSKFFKFNNSGLYTGASLQGEDYDEDEDDLGKMFWKLGASNFTKFINDMKTTQKKTLTQTKEVLEERHKLEITISSINESIKEGLNKLEELDIQQKLLKQHEADLDRNKHFSQQTETFTKERQYMKNGEYVTICKDCKHNCHYPCNCIYDQKDCKVFEYNGDYCNTCPNKCAMKRHKYRNYKYVEKRVKTVVHSSEIKQKYEEALGKIMPAKEMIKYYNEEFKAVQKQTYEIIEHARECIMRLDEIALKPNPLSTTDYIDLMIQEEEFLKQPGWRETVQQLQQIKRQANDLLQLAQTGYKENSKSKAEAKDEAAEAGKMSETTI